MDIGHGLAEVGCNPSLDRPTETPDLLSSSPLSHWVSMSSSHRSSYSSYASSRRSRDDDEISLISMREVAPSPVEDHFDTSTPRDASPAKIDLTHISSSIASQNTPKTRNLAFWRMMLHFSSQP